MEMWQQQTVVRIYMYVYADACARLNDAILHICANEIPTRTQTTGVAINIDCIDMRHQ